MWAAIIKNRKVELFFILALFLSFAPLGSAVHAVFSFLLILFFLKGRWRIFALLLLIVFGVTVKYNIIVIEHMFDTKAAYVYKTTGGTYFSDVKLQSGDVLSGHFLREMTEYGLNISSEGRKYSFRLPIISALLSARKSLSEKLYYHSGLKSGLTNALVMGDKSFLSDSLVDKFTVAGLNHLLAISGLHVGIILGVILWGLSFLHLKLRFLVALPFLILLIPFTGFKITVIRAVIFAFIVMTAYIFDIKTDLRKMILLTAAIFMLADPGIIRDISFLLSFSAVFGIVYLLRKKNTLENWDKFSWIKEPVKVGIAATIFTSPFILYYFGNFNYLGVLSTIVMLPFISVLIILGFGYLLIPDVMVQPIVVFEHLSRETLNFIYNLTYPFFVLNKIEFWVFLSVMFIMLLIIMTKRKFLLLFVLLVPLFSWMNSEGIYIPKMVRSKGFINVTEGKREIFYKGWYSDFKYRFLPLAAELSLKEFDVGDINIYNGKNKYLKIDNVTKNFSNICINKISPGCRYIFNTRSNTVNKKDYSKSHTYLIYKNKLEKENIIQLSRYKKAVRLLDGEVNTFD